MKKILIVLFLVIAANLLGFTSAQAADFNPNLIITDSDFININSMDTAAIQRFLEGKNSYLKDFSENGRSAAKIIYDAAHGYGDASGTYNGIVINTSTGTVSPGVILTTLQKEQSLISKSSKDENAIDRAMGYACPDGSGCNPNYAGFTKQVENAAWTFRYNYQRLVRGDCIGISGADPICVTQGTTTTMNNRSWESATTSITLGSKATAVLYRYTPHVYNGNYNFWNLFHNTYQFQVGEYRAQFAGQSAYPTLWSGQTAELTIRYKNTGTSTWRKGVVNLATVDRNFSPRFDAHPTARYWYKANRPARLNEDSVAPGATGSFTFTVRNNALAGGNYRLDVGLVADGATWFSKETHAYWDITVNPAYRAQFAGQSRYPTLWSGQTTDLTIRYKNTGSVTWRRGVVNLGTVNQDYSWRNDPHPTARNWVNPNRPARLNEATVAPGETGSFTFTVRNNALAGGNYRLDVGLVADGIGWFEKNTHAYWDIYVKPAYQAEFAGQSRYPTLWSGQTAELTIRYKNTGSVSWRKGIVSIGTVNPDFSWRTDSHPVARNWISGNRPARLNEDVVAPGETGSFTFTVRNNALTPGNYRLDVGLVADGIGWFDRSTHAYWDITATK
jgi:hypothetical protein